jgi:phytoene synthase
MSEAGLGGPTELAGRGQERLDFASVLAAGSKSFSFAARFLPPADRADAAVVYTFCRVADDAADEAESPDAGRAAVDALSDAIRGRRPAGPVVSAFLRVADRRGIDLRHAEELLAGVASDLGEVDIADDGALVRYGYRVAGTVGLLMCPIIGVTNPEAYPFAVDLGVGMQLTNICRDVAEDAARGRVYLPRARLERVGLEPRDLVSGDLGRDPAGRRALARVVSEVISLADLYYASGDRGLAYIPLRPRIAILVASRVYRAIGRKLVADGCDALAGRVVISRSGKVGRAALALARLLVAPRLLGLSRPPDHVARLHAPLVGLPGADPRAAVPARQLEGARA